MSYIYDVYTKIHIYKSHLNVCLKQFFLNFLQLNLCQIQPPPRCGRTNCWALNRIQRGGTDIPTIFQVEKVLKQKSRGHDIISPKNAVFSGETGISLKNHHTLASSLIPSQKWVPFYNPWKNPTNLCKLSKKDTVKLLEPIINLCWWVWEKQNFRLDSANSKSGLKTINAKSNFCYELRQAIAKSDTRTFSEWLSFFQRFFFVFKKRWY